MTSPDASTPSAAAAFADRVRGRHETIGYWVMMDTPVSTERIARAGYDYVCVDAQHGMLDYKGMLANLTAIDAGGRSVGLVRVGANDPFHIGQALDSGAVGIIVPLVNSAADAAQAVASAMYPPVGVRSYGPMRSSLRIGPVPAEANAAITVMAMIETPEGLANVEEICAVPGLAGVYIGPSDLGIAVGAAFPGDPAIGEPFEAALVRIRSAAEASGIASGIHTPSGAEARRRLDQGFTLATVASDLVHLDLIARDHLAQARPTS